MRAAARPAPLSSLPPPVVAVAFAPAVRVAPIERARIVRHVRGDRVVAVDLARQRLRARLVVPHGQAGEGVVGGGAQRRRARTARPARARGRTRAPTAGAHALNHLEQVTHEVEGELRAHRVEGFLERPRVVVLLREIDDEFRQRLVRDAYVVLQLRRDLIHQGEVRELVERHRGRPRPPPNRDSPARRRMRPRGGGVDDVRGEEKKRTSLRGANFSSTRAAASEMSSRRPPAHAPDRSAIGPRPQPDVARFTPGNNTTTRARLRCGLRGAAP